MKKEFNLSEKIFRYGTSNISDVVYVTNIKEFIKRYDNLNHLWINKKISYNEYLKRRRKLIGDKLIWKQ